VAAPRPNQPKEPATRIPKKATKFSADLWAKSVGERIQLLIDPKPETARDFIRAGIESFGPEDLVYFIENDMDLIPVLHEWMELDNKWVQPWAKTVVRIWWPQIYGAAMNPQQILAEIRVHDPAKGAVLDTPRGRIWLNATIFNLLSFFRAFGEIEGAGVIQPPPNLPERLKRYALKGAARVTAAVRGRQ
jgi:vacuolar-type H+-ATPase subunit E/Vma4